MRFSTPYIVFAIVNRNDTKNRTSFLRGITVHVEVRDKLSNGEIDVTKGPYAVEARYVNLAKHVILWENKLWHISSIHSKNSFRSGSGTSSSTSMRQS